jgi:ComF family protein
MFVAVRCRVCRRVLRCSGSSPVGRTCAECDVLGRATPSPRSTAAVVYDSDVRELIADLKYRSRRRAARALASRLVADIRADPEAPQFDVVTWAPTTSRRVGARGYDQSELLARHVARRLGLPCRRLLERSRGPAQTGRGRRERLVGPVFRSRPMSRPMSVLVIDDVITTGATIAAAAHALRLAGARDVEARAVASTPERRRGSPTV